MCGIAGVVYEEQRVDKSVILQMLNKISHRGPDGHGFFTDGNMGVGHTRLSIIDPRNGKQPMANESGSILITFNGEIYNFREIRDYLQKRGHTFRTQSDTEVIIHSYEEWGKECVKRFRGMFSFCIIDYLRNELFLARDPFGIKPLVYLEIDGMFAFASEIQALRVLPGVVWNVDLKAVDEYLWLQYIPAPKTIFKAVRKLPPAHYMIVTFQGKVNSIQRYWQFNFTPDEKKTRSEWLEELDDVLRKSVQAHLVSDVPFGSFLSGGVDSSGIVAYMAQLMDKPVKTFSIGFDESEYDESKYAKYVSDKWQTEHYQEIIRPDALQILPKLVEHYGEPFGDSSAVPTYYVSRLAKQHVSMVLSGDGGDELFAGYQSYQSWMNQIEPPFYSDGYPLWKRTLRPMFEYLFPGRYKKVVRHSPNLKRWINCITYIPSELRHELWRKEYKSYCQDKLDVFEELYASCENLDVLQRVQYSDLHTYLPFDILTKVDAASMMHGLEVRTPLIDPVVAEFVAKIPRRFNFDGQKMQGKLLLKQILEKYYPREFLFRKKQGFAMPIKRWFSDEDVFNKEVSGKLLSKGALIHELFQTEVIHYIINGTNDGQIWVLLFLEEWLNANRDISLNP